MIRAVFAAIAALAVIAALGGLSWAVVSADRAETRANAVRLALWRLDAQATVLVLPRCHRFVNAHLSNR